MSPSIVRIEYNRFPEIARRLPVEASKVVRTTAFEVEADIKRRMAEGPKTGRLYVRSVRVTERARSLVVTRTYHQASAPGEAPAIDTGHLVNSIQTDAKPGALNATVYSTAEYAAILEYGGVHLEPRPVWVPAGRKAAERYRRRMEEMLKRLTRG